MRYIFLTIALLLLGGINAQAAEIIPSEVRFFDAQGNIEKSFLTVPEKYVDGMSISVADLGTDNQSEIIIANGPGMEPRVFIYTQDGLLLTSFLAYAPTFGKGVHLATGDLNGDGQNEIVTGTGLGGGPHVRIFDSNGVASKTSFFAYDKSFRGGVFVTVGDLDGDGKSEIITGSGIEGVPMVRIFSGEGVFISEFLAFDEKDLSGVTVGTADVDGDGKLEILTGRASIDTSELKIFSYNGSIKNVLTLVDVFRDGINAQGADCNADGTQELLVSSNGTDGVVQCIKNDGVKISSFQSFSKDFNGAVRVVWNKLSPDDKGTLIVAPSRAYKIGNVNLPQEINVNLSEQRLYAYEYGQLVKTFLISSGVAKFPTPPGNYSVQKKIPLKDYVWTYGINNPNNYNLPNVKWNLQFRPRYYLHYAYWHNNFGTRMSHGCVNMPLEASEWIYSWAKEGTPVIIK